MSDSVILTNESKPEDALNLPRKNLILSKGLLDCPFENNHVIECATLIIKNGGREEAFESQAEVVAYAGNHLDWGAGGDYYVF